MHATSPFRRMIAVFVLAALAGLADGHAIAQSAYAPYAPPVTGSDPAAGREFDVVKLDRKHHLLILNGGVNLGLFRGRPICVYDDENEIGCYKIAGVKAATSAIQVPKKDFSKFKKGMTARATSPQREESAAPPPAGGRSYFTIGYTYCAVLPFSFSMPEFSLDQKLSGAGKVWAPGKRTITTPTALRMMLESAFSPTFGVQAGVILRYLTDQKVQTDFDPDDPERYTDHRLHAQSLGIPVQARWFFPIGNSLVVLAPGFEWDYSQVQYRVWSAKDSARERTLLVDYLSVLNTGGIRVDLGLATRIGLMSHATFGLGIIIPFTSFGGARSVHVNAPEDWPGGRDQTKDITEAVNHRASHAAVEIPFTMSIGF